jgi:hypothetical protein
MKRYSLCVASLAGAVPALLAATLVSAQSQTGEREPMSRHEQVSEGASAEQRDESEGRKSPTATTVMPGARNTTSATEETYTGAQGRKRDPCEDGTTTRETARRPSAGAIANLDPGTQAGREKAQDKARCTSGPANSSTRPATR